MARPKLYLAGPDVFFAEAAAVAATRRQACDRAGMEGLWPCDNVAPGAGAAAIYAGNCALMDQADGAIAHIRPWRGPGLDGGTAFEIGYLTAQGKPVFGWSADRRSYRDKAALSHGPLAPGAAGLVDRDGCTVEGFGSMDNLMITVSLACIEADFEAALGRAAAHFLAPNLAG